MGEGQEGGVPAGLGTLQIPGRWGHRGTWGRTAWRVWGWLGRAASFPSLCARSSFFLPGFLRVTYLNTLINISLRPALLHKPSASHLGIQGRVVPGCPVLLGQVQYSHGSSC